MAPLLLAHQGGWDERVAVLVPVVGAVVLAWVLLRRPHRAQGGPATAVPDAVRRRRGTAGALAATFLALDLLALGLFDLGERATAVVRNLLLPGLGLFVVSTPLALAFLATAILALAAWTRWGTDWVVGMVWAASVVAALVLVDPAPAGGDPDQALPILVASHEFALVMFAVALVVRARSFLAGLPGVRWLRRRGHTGRPEGLAGIVRLRAVDRTRVAAVVAIAERLGEPVPDREPVLASLTSSSIRRRAHLVGIAARWRFRGDPLRLDGAPARAALALWGCSSEIELTALRDDARRRWTGVPASEPTWVRLLDGTLVAAALAELGEHECVRRWDDAWSGPLGLRGGHRPSCVHTPLAIGGAWAPTWEHAAASALGRVLGRGGDEDWTALRRRCLGAAARGPEVADDERLIAAGRIWALTVDDEQALRILARPTVRRDPMAVALDHVATAVAARRGAGQRSTPV